MDKKIKISSTAYRVLLLLLHLNNGCCNTDHLNKIFVEDKYVSRYFSKDVILKYIITLRTAGYNISKPTKSNEYIYELHKSPVLIDLSDQQIKNLAILYCYVEGFHQSKIVENYENFLKKIKKFIPEKQVQLLNKELKKQRENLEKTISMYSSQKELIQRIENLMKEKRRVAVRYKLSDKLSGSNDENQIILELNNIKYLQKEVYVSGYSPLTEQTHSIKLENIVDIKQLPTKLQYGQILSPVIFRLKGALAKGYRVYENEKITNPQGKSGSLTVTAYVDDKDMLLKRLLKYGENCEVLYPKNAQCQMVKIILTYIVKGRQDVLWKIT